MVKEPPESWEKTPRGATWVAHQSQSQLVDFQPREYETGAKDALLTACQESISHTSSSSSSEDSSGNADEALPR